MATTEQRLKEYEDAYKKASTYNANKFQTDFEKAYGEATGYNQDLINQQSQALGELQSVAPTLRGQYANSLITDPTRQMALIAQARQAPITSWSNAANLLTARGQKYSDILNKALGAYQTEAEQSNIAAENAWRLYQDAVAREEARRAAASKLNLGDLLNTGYNQQTPTTATKATDETASPFFQALTKAAQWQPENKTAANIYNTLTNTLGKFVYENPTPADWIKNLFNRGGYSRSW